MSAGKTLPTFIRGGEGWLFLERLPFLSPRSYLVAQVGLESSRVQTKIAFCLHLRWAVALPHFRSRCCWLDDLQEQPGFPGSCTVRGSPFPPKPVFPTSKITCRECFFSNEGRIKAQQELICQRAPGEVVMDQRWKWNPRLSLCLPHHPFPSLLPGCPGLMG